MILRSPTENENANLLVMPLWILADPRLTLFYESKAATTQIKVT